MKMTTTIQETNDYDKAGRLSKEDELMMADPSRKEFCGVSVTADAIKVRTKVVENGIFENTGEKGILFRFFESMTVSVDSISHFELCIFSTMSTIIL